MKFLESLNQHRYSNKQFYEEDLHSLHEQADSKKALVQHEQEQYWLIVGIEEKVNQSLSSLLSIYRSINLDILQCQCFLEKIPSKSELLFFENEITKFIDLIVEGSAKLSQYYDILNSLRNVYNPYRAHLQFLLSLLSAIRNNRSSFQSVAYAINDKISSVIQQLTTLVQQHNTELKKKNRLLKVTATNQSVVQEKIRLHSKLMHTFQLECENNKELKKRLRELQGRRSQFR